LAVGRKRVFYGDIEVVTHKKTQQKKTKTTSKKKNPRTNPCKHTTKKKHNQQLSQKTRQIKQKLVSIYILLITIL